MINHKLSQQKMGKGNKDLPRLNQVLALLVKAKESQVSVANALGISSQSLGYYLRGRKVPASVIDRWEDVYKQNLIALSKQDFETDFETIVLRDKKARVQIDGGYTRMATPEELETLNMELFKQLQKDHEATIEQLQKEIDRAWGLINRLVPQVGVKIKTNRKRIDS